MRAVSSAAIRRADMPAPSEFGKNIGQLPSPIRRCGLVGRRQTLGSVAAKADTASLRSL
jgi:hypothetical protein